MQTRSMSRRDAAAAIRAASEAAKAAAIAKQPLSIRNAHPRDNHILFIEQGHIYNINGDTGYTSVTKFVHQYTNPFDADKVIAGILAKGTNEKYTGMTAGQISAMWKTNGREARVKGTKMHYGIECHYNKSGGAIDFLWSGLDSELRQFNSFLDDHKHLEAFRTEWAVFDETKRLSGSIDMVFFNKTTGKYDIYDWKRTKEIKKTGFNNMLGSVLSYLPDCNYWHYSLQLNMYKYILTTRYNMDVDELYLVAMYPGQGGYIKYKVPDMQEDVKQLLADGRG